MLQELKEELKLTDEQVQSLTQVFEKKIQSETDKIRTEYSQKVKELERFKPVEKSETEIELENLKKELSETKFQKSLKDIGVSDDLGKYLKSDIDLGEFQKFYDGFKTTSQKEFIPTKNQNNIGMTKEEFSKMNIEQRTKLYNENPELYSQLKQ